MAAYLGSSWHTLMTSYTQKWGQEDGSKVELNEYFFSAKNLLERKSIIHWLIFYLQKYLTESIVPFGLRLKLFPNFKDVSSGLFDQLLSESYQALD